MLHHSLGPSAVILLLSLSRCGSGVTGSFTPEGREAIFSHLTVDAPPSVFEVSPLEPLAAFADLGAVDDKTFIESLKEHLTRDDSSSPSTLAYLVKAIPLDFTHRTSRSALKILWTVVPIQRAPQSDGDEGNHSSLSSHLRDAWRQIQRGSFEPPDAIGASASSQHFRLRESKPSRSLAEGSGLEEAEAHHQDVEIQFSDISDACLPSSAHHASSSGSSKWRCMLLVVVQRTRVGDEAEGSEAGGEWEWEFEKSVERGVFAMSIFSHKAMEDVGWRRPTPLTLLSLGKPLVFRRGDIERDKLLVMTYDRLISTGIRIRLSSNSLHTVKRMFVIQCAANFAEVLRGDVKEMATAHKVSASSGSQPAFEVLVSRAARVNLTCSLANPLPRGCCQWGRNCPLYIVVDFLPTSDQSGDQDMFTLTASEWNATPVSPKYALIPTAAFLRDAEPIHTLKQGTRKHFYFAAGNVVKSDGSWPKSSMVVLTAPYATKEEKRSQAVWEPNAADVHLIRENVAVYALACTPIPHTLPEIEQFWSVNSTAQGGPSTIRHDFVGIPTPRGEVVLEVFHDHHQKSLAGSSSSSSFPSCISRIVVEHRKRGLPSVRSAAGESTVRFRLRHVTTNIFAPATSSTGLDRYSTLPIKPDGFTSFFSFPVMFGGAGNTGEFKERVDLPFVTDPKALASVSSQTHPPKWLYSLDVCSLPSEVLASEAVQLPFGYMTANNFAPRQGSQDTTFEFPSLHEVVDLASCHLFEPRAFDFAASLEQQRRRLVVCPPAVTKMSETIAGLSVSVRIAAEKRLSSGNGDERSSILMSVSVAEVEPSVEKKAPVCLTVSGRDNTSVSFGVEGGRWSLWGGGSSNSDNNFVDLKSISGKGEPLYLLKSLPAGTNTPITVRANPLQGHTAVVKTLKDKVEIWNCGGNGPALDRTNRSLHDVEYVTYQLYVQAVEDRCDNYVRSSCYWERVSSSPSVSKANITDATLLSDRRIRGKARVNIRKLFANRRTECVSQGQPGASSSPMLLRVAVVGSAPLDVARQRLYRPYAYRSALIDVTSALSALPNPISDSDKINRQRVFDDTVLDDETSSRSSKTSRPGLWQAIRRTAWTLTLLTVVALILAVLGAAVLVVSARVRESSRRQGGVRGGVELFASHSWRLSERPRGDDTVNGHQVQTDRATRSSGKQSNSDIDARELANRLASSADTPNRQSGASKLVRTSLNFSSSGSHRAAYRLLLEKASDDDEEEEEKCVGESSGDGSRG